MLVSETHPASVWLIVPLAVLVNLVALRMRCPNCKRRVIWQGYFMFPYLPKRCRYCRHDLGSKGPRTGTGN
jgi:uncharacterized protein (DUF983 family)